VLKKKLVAMLLSLVLVLGLSPVNAIEGYTSVYPENQYFYIDLDDLEIIDDFGLLEQFDTRLLECDYLFAQFLEVQYIMNAQSKSIEAYSLLMEYFLTIVDGNAELVFPNNYAGAFVDVDTLVIRLTDISDEATAFYKNILDAFTSEVVFEQVSFSMNQLTDFGEIFVYAMDAPLVSFGVDTLENSYLIVLDENYDYSAQIVNNFNVSARFLPIPVRFELGQPMEPTSGLTGGSAIINSRLNNMSVGATGYRVVGNVRRGNALLTTGHAFIGLPVGTSVIRTGQVIGTLAMFRVGSHSAGSPGTANGDWAIIDLNANGQALVTRNLRNGLALNGVTASPPVGTQVFGLGQLDTVSGSVLFVNQSVFDSVNHITLSGITVASGGGAVRPSNSGGTVYVLVNQRPVLAGVIQGNGVTQWGFSPFLWKSAHFAGL